MLQVLEDDTESVLSLCDSYAAAVQNLHRQLNLQANELLRGAAMTRLELTFKNLQREHYSLIKSHLTSDIFNILEDASTYQPIKVINFTACPPQSVLSKQSTANFDKMVLPASNEKQRLEEFETHSSFMVKLDQFEKVNIGHIYCVADIRKKSKIISGKFGTAICNDYDQIISKIKHHAERIYNCRFWKANQLYFPADEKVFIWKDDGIAMTFNHVFNGGLAHEMLHFSKCVQSVGSLVYFLAVPSQIIELDWTDIEYQMSLGAQHYTGRLIFEAKGITDFFVHKKMIYYVNSSNRIGKVHVSQDYPSTQQSLIDPNHLSYFAITANDRKVIVAGHQESITSNYLFILNHALTTESKVALNKLDKGYNPVRSLHMIEREDACYLLCVCSIDLVILFVETTTSLSRLEQLCMSKEEDKAIINGVHFDPTKSKVLVFGDFNFQQMLKLRV